MFIKSKNNILFIILIVLFSCEESKTVSFTPRQQSPGTVDQSTLLPQIQFFYPGVLQTLDVPYPIPTDIPPDSAHIILIFSDIMENSDGQMSNWVSLQRNDSEQDFTITPDNSSAVFEIIPDNAITPCTAACFNYRSTRY